MAIGRAGETANTDFFLITQFSLHSFLVIVKLRFHFLRILALGLRKKINPQKCAGFIFFRDP